MLKAIKRFLGSQKGQTLPIALALLTLGGFLIVPLLDLMTGSINYHRVIEEYDMRYYDADAGIHKMLWHIWQHNIPLPEEDEEFRLSDYDSDFRPPNGSDVEVTLTLASGGARPVYKLVSVATSPDNYTTEIECYLSGGVDYSSLFERAISSPSTVNVQPGGIIYGGVTCGTFSGDPSSVKTGGIEQGATVVLPTEEELSAFYSQKVDKNNPYPGATYTVSGGTVANPVEIPALYRNGNLSIQGSGYAKLSGTIYVDGKFDFSDKDVILDLNGQTIYATYYNNCSGNAIYFGPDTMIIGPGCVIGIGNIDFQPKLGQGRFLLGAGSEADDNNPYPWQTEPANRLVLQRFEATESGTLSSFQIRCLAPPNPENPPKIKVALYSNNDNGTPKDTSDDKPGIVLTWDEAEVNITEDAWFAVDLELPALQDPGQYPVSARQDREVAVSKKTYYWLVAVADAAIISREATTTSDSKYMDISDFEGFQFTDNPSGPFTSPGYREHLRGFSGGQEFIMLMSVKCTTNLQPNGSLFGAIVGNTTVNLQPGCFINLVGLPEGGLDFPSMSSGYDLAGSQRIQSYRVK